MKAKLFGIGLLLVTPNVSMADPDRVSVLLGSSHVGATSDFNDFNPGLFLSWEERLTLSAGVFYNSYEKISVAGVAGFPIVRTDDYAVEVIGGLAYYPEDGRRFAVHFGDVVPLLGLQGRAGPVFAQVIPGGGQAVDAIVSVGLTFSLNR